MPIHKKDGTEFGFNDLFDQVKKALWGATSADTFSQLVFHTGKYYLFGVNSNKGYVNGVILTSLRPFIPATFGYTIRKVTNELYGKNTAESYLGGFCGGFSKYFFRSPNFSLKEGILGGINGFLYERNKHHFEQSAKEGNFLDFYGKVFCIETIIEQFVLRHSSPTNSSNIYAALLVPLTITISAKNQEMWADSLNKVIDGITSVLQEVIADIVTIVPTISNFFPNNELPGNEEFNNSVAGESKELNILQGATGISNLFVE